MEYIEQKGVTYLRFKKWVPYNEMVHGFSTIKGGVSKGYLESLNLGFNRGDERENVIENYHRICDALEVPFDSLVLSKQVHETHISKVTKEMCGNGIVTPNRWESMDGIYTNEKGITLVTHYADCVPLFFYAPEYGMIGMAHAGWRGTVGEIGKKMVQTWRDIENIPVEAIEVVIGPSIGPCHFEVDEGVKKAFDEKSIFHSAISKRNINNKYFINLWECNKQSLISAGILEHNITISGICTYCESEMFYSHRRMQGKRGTLAGFMYLKEEI